MAVVWLIIKIVLWLLAAILLLVAAALLVPITAELCYENCGFTAAVRIFMLRFPIYPFSPCPKDSFWARFKLKSKRQKKQDKPAPQSSASQDAEQNIAKTAVTKEVSPEPSEKKHTVQHHRATQVSSQSVSRQTDANKPKATKKSNGHSASQKFLWSLDTIKVLVATAGGAIRRVLAGLLIHDIRIVMPVQMEDAASTALAVGGIHAGLHATLGILNNFFRLRFEQLVVIPDYTGEYEGQEHFSCKVTTHLIIMVIIAVWAFMQLKKEKIIR